jgi:ABC-2 type transport system permease protein
VAGMLRSIFLKTCRDQRKALMWWISGLLFLAFYLAALYPSIARTPGYSAMIQAWPKELIATVLGESADYSTASGYLNSSLFFMAVPLLFLVYAVVLGSNAVAGEEERKTMDLLLANPVPRWRVILEKFAALVVLTLVLAVSLWLGLVAGAAWVHMDVGLVRMGEATLSAALLGIAFGALALAVGCLRGNRGLSVGVATAIAVIAYFLNSLAPVVASLQPYRKLSLFYYFIGADPLRNGLNLGHAAVLVAVSLTLVIVGIFAFQRRDVGV